MTATELGPDVDRGWFPDDAAAHRRDAPRFCPGCGGSIALATEYWVAHDRVFVCICTTCGWTGDIVLSDRVVGHEPS